MTQPFRTKFGVWSLRQILTPTSPLDWLDCAADPRVGRCWLEKLPNQMKHYQTRWNSKSSKHKSHIPRTQRKTHRHQSKAVRAAGWSLICVSSSHYLLRSVQRKSARAASAEHLCRAALPLTMVPSSQPLKNYPWLLLNLCQMIRLGLHPRTPLRPSRDSAGRVTANA